MRAGFGASTGTNSSEAAPTRKPAGSPACDSSQARWAARSAKVKGVLDMAPFSPFLPLASIAGAALVATSDASGRGATPARRDRWPAPRARLGVR